MLSPTCIMLLQSISLKGVRLVTVVPSASGLTSTSIWSKKITYRVCDDFEPLHDHTVKFPVLMRLFIWSICLDLPLVLPVEVVQRAADAHAQHHHAADDDGNGDRED